MSEHKINSPLSTGQTMIMSQHTVTMVMVSVMDWDSLKSENLALRQKVDLLEGNTRTILELQRQNAAYIRDIDQLREENKTLKDKVSELEATICNHTAIIAKHASEVSDLRTIVDKMRRSQLAEKLRIAFQDLNRYYDLEHCSTTPFDNNKLQSRLKQMHKNRNNAAHFFLEGAHGDDDYNAIGKMHILKRQIDQLGSRTTVEYQSLDKAIGRGIIDAFYGYISKELQTSNINTYDADDLEDYDAFFHFQ